MHRNAYALGTRRSALDTATLLAVWIERADLLWLSLLEAGTDCLNALT